MSAEIQESLNNFKVIVAFNRRDYFRKRFKQVNDKNFSTAVSAGYANNMFTPVYGMAASIAQMITLFYGIYLITAGEFTIGLLISYISYLTRFYDPIRQIAGLWSTFQIALAGWDRITEILSLESDMPIIESEKKKADKSVLSFKNVSFKYPEGKDVLRGINFNLEPGKTYALVGPTGGGKTTTASLMARLYDATGGDIYLDGKDIRAYTPSERTKKIGFILQEPFLFTGTVRENILYGNEEYLPYSDDELAKVLQQFHLDRLLERFDKGLQTTVNSQGESVSLGQRQLIAFMRAVLRNPELLILDEATANIDTVTEQLLDDILKQLPETTTRVIIAHRLNTIENADEIFFINSGEITRAGSLKHAISMLMEGKRES
jgi:ATP-binding cassette subfamily B protein